MITRRQLILGTISVGLAAGLAVGITSFVIAEPVSHTAAYSVDPGIAQAARESLERSLDQQAARGADATAAESQRREAARIAAERIAAEEAARVEAERIAAEEAAKVEAERVAVERAAAELAERKAADETRFDRAVRTGTCGDAPVGRQIECVNMVEYRAEAAAISNGWNDSRGYVSPGTAERAVEAGIPVGQDVPGYLRCGTMCGEAPTSGEVQSWGQGLSEVPSGYEEWSDPAFTP